MFRTARRNATLISLKNRTIYKLKKKRKEKGKRNFFPIYLTFKI